MMMRMTVMVMIVIMMMMMIVIILCEFKLVLDTGVVMLLFLSALRSLDSKAVLAVSGKPQSPNCKTERAIIQR